MSDASPAEPTRHRFRLGPLLGAGTFGEVYLARMTSLHGIEQDVAVKLLNPGLSPKSQPVSRMRDEGRMLAAVNHPAILHVMDFCFLDGRIGLVTEFVPGADLHDCIFGLDPIPPRAALQVVGTCADALHAAYEARTDTGERMALVHRDIKPANIRVTPHGTVKVLDFGIAKSEDERRETETTERVAIGTPSYMAPEVQSYEVLEALPSRDVFALGCTLYESLVGEMFFEGLSTKEISRLCIREDRFADWRAGRLPRLARHGPRILELVSRMLRYDHTQRPTSREVADTCLELAERGDGETLRAWGRRRAWPEVGGKAGPWSGRELQDVGVATRIDAAAPNATLGAYLDDDGTGRGTPANPTLIVADEERATQLVEQAVQAAVRTIAQAQPTVIVQAPPPRRRRSLFTTLSRAFAFLATVGILLAIVVLFLRPDEFGAMMRGEWGVVLDAFGLGSNELVVTGADAATTDALEGEAYVWGATQSDDVATVAVHFSSGDAVLTRPDFDPITAAPTASAKMPPGAVEIRPAGGGAALVRELVAGDTLRVTCSDAGCEAL